MHYSFNAMQEAIYLSNEIVFKCNSASCLERYVPNFVFVMQGCTDFGLDIEHMLLMSLI